MIWNKTRTYTEQSLYQLFSKELPDCKIQIESFSSGAFIIDMASYKDDVYIEITKNGLIGVSIINNKKWEDIEPFSGADIEFTDIDKVINYIKSKLTER